MNLDRLLERLATSREQVVLSSSRSVTGEEIVALCDRYRSRLTESGLTAGKVVALSGRPSVDTIALLLAAASLRAVVLPLGSSEYADSVLDEAEVEFLVKSAVDGCLQFSKRSVKAGNALLEQLRAAGRPGLVLLTSGTTGKPKAVLHDLDRLLAKYSQPGKTMRTLCFFGLDHIAGFDTAMYCLVHGGGLVIPDGQDPKSVCSAIEAYGVEVLPTSPTFLNLLLLSGEIERHDLSALKIITFGSERMPEAVLNRVREAFPKARILQKYGTSEFGSPSSKSDSDDPLWIKVDSDRFKIRVQDGVLYVKAETTMLGYLNAPSPLTDDGWLNTGDLVETRGDYIRVLGRKSSIINVGGQKVYPAEVENTILSLDNVLEATVYGRPNPITGQVVCARVRLAVEEDPGEFVTRLKRHCLARMEKYKVPVHVETTLAPQHNDRFKKLEIQPLEGQ